MADKLIAALLISAIALTLAGCSSTENSETPAVTSEPKFVGSNSIIAGSMKHIPTFDDHVLFGTDRIVIGVVDSVDELFEGFLTGTEDNPRPPSHTATYYNVVVTQTILGVESDEITVAMMGTPDSNWGMTKPPLGSRVLLILEGQFSERRNEVVYTPTGFEKSVFLINDDDTVYSLHDDPITAQFDGQPLSVLVAEIERILDEGDFSDEFIESFRVEYQSELREHVEQNRERRRQQNNQGENDDNQGGNGNSQGGNGNSQGGSGNSQGGSGQRGQGGNQQ
jgi:uncharacterized membrane protein YgcG